MLGVGQLLLHLLLELLDLLLQLLFLLKDLLNSLLQLLLLVVGCGLLSQDGLLELLKDEIIIANVFSFSQISEQTCSWVTFLCKSASCCWLCTAFCCRAASVAWFCCFSWRCC